MPIFEHLIMYCALVLGRILFPVRFLFAVLGRANGLTVLSPSRKGSLGDEAMMNVACWAVEKRYGKLPKILIYLPKERFILDGIELPVLALTGRTPMNTALCLLRNIWDVCQCRLFILVGGDILDGYYSPYRTILRLSLLSLYAGAGVRSTILGFSFNDTPDALTIWAWKKVPQTVRLCARDPLSKRRLEAMLDRPVKLTADLAFQLKPAKTSHALQALRDWISKRRSNGAITIGINANALMLAKSSKVNKDIEVNVFAETMVNLAEHLKKISFILIAHDYRPNSDDLRLIRRIEDGIPEALREACRLLPGSLSANEIKLLAGELDFAISCRLHFTIACLGQGIPVLSISYQDKFEGLYQLFGIDELVINPRMLKNAGGFSTVVLTAIEKCDEIHNRILKKLDGVLVLSHSNFDDL